MRDRRRRPAMRRFTLLLILPLLALAAGWLRAAQTPAPGKPPGNNPAPKAPAKPATRIATQGELAILNRQGEPVGLCPLRHTTVTADVSGYVARVNVEQEFANPSKEPVEAVYTFPLPDDAA